MTIQYADGRTVQAEILSRSDRMVRVAIQGGDDAVEFTSVNGTWISEDCEPVRMEFAWERHELEEPVSEADYVCSKELASRLIHLLLEGTDEDELAKSFDPNYENAGMASSFLPI